MAKFQGVAYEPHPVTPERKAELRAQGMKIIDIAFKPADAEPAAEPAPVAAPRATRRGKSEE